MRETTEAEVLALFQRLLADWPINQLQQPLTRLDVLHRDPDWYVTYETDKPWKEDVNRFNVQMLGGVFHILTIQIAPEHRGKGLGWQLYQLLEQAARELDCFLVQMTASGWTPSGEYRGDWLKRRGYQLTSGCIAYKALKERDNGETGRDQFHEVAYGPPVREPPPDHLSA